MTDSSPDDNTKNEEAKAADTAHNDTAQNDTAQNDTAQNDTPTSDAGATQDSAAADAGEDTAPAAPKKKRAAEVEDDYDDGDYEDADDDYEDTPRRPARRPRPRPARRAPAAAAASGPSTIATVIATVVTLVLLATTILFAVLWFLSRSEVKDMRNEAADIAQAEKVAGEYAVGASTFDYRDLGPWRTALTKGVSDDLKKRLETTVGAMNQLLQPLQWVSKSTVSDAVVNSHSGSIYKVTVYVNVEATNVQATSGRDVVTVYNVTLDKDKDWEITDVGGSPTDAAQAAAPTAGTETPAPAPTETAAPAAPAPTETVAPEPDGAGVAPTPAPGG